VRLTAVSGTGGTTTLVWDQIRLQPTVDGFVLGTRDNSSAEFAQANFNGLFDADTMPASQLPYQLSQAWFGNPIPWPAQDIEFTASSAQQQRGYVITLDCVAYNPGNPGLDSGYTIDVWDYNTSGGLVYLDTVYLVGTYSAAVYIPPSRVLPGKNRLHLVLQSYATSYPYLTWDQIKVQTARLLTNSVLGVANGSAAEFAPTNSDHLFLANHTDASVFGRELNKVDWKWQDFGFLPEDPSKGVVATLDAAALLYGSSSTNPFLALVDLDTGSELIRLTQRFMTTTGVERIVVPAGLLTNGIMRVVVSAGEPGAGNYSSGMLWDQVRLEKSSQVLLGQFNDSDGEFAQDGAAYRVNWDADTMAMTNLAKEINNNWYSNQFIAFTADPALASNGLLVSLVAKAQDGSGALQVALDANNIPARTNAIDASTKGVYLVPPSSLVAGTNTLRIMGKASVGNTAWLIWDQIRIEAASYGGGVRIGEDDGSNAELLGDSQHYDHQFAARSMPSRLFPREVNTIWWTYQDIALVLDAAKAAQGLTATLDVTWQDAPGTMGIEVSVDKGNGYVVAGTSSVSAAAIGTLAIPPSLLATGLNRVRLRPLSTGGALTTVAWDRVWIE
jgi:hypothetical protein